MNNSQKFIDSDEDIKERELKIILVGDNGVGKTSLIKRLTQETFSIQYIPTKGIEFYIKKLEINNIKITLKIWDISGDSLTNKMIETYLHNSKAIFFVYDISNQESFNNLKEWVNTISQILKNKKVKDKPYFGLLGNKVDLMDSHNKSLQNESFVKDNNMISYILSAKNGVQVLPVFSKVSCDVLGLTYKEDQNLNLFLKAINKDEKIIKSDIGAENLLYPPKNTFEIQPAQEKKIKNLKNETPIPKEVVNIDNLKNPPPYSKIEQMEKIEFKPSKEKSSVCNSF